MKKNDVLDFLLNEGQDKKVLLFEDSKTMRDFSNNVVEDLKARNNLIVATTNKFKVTNNIVELGGRKIFIGLKKDEVLLQNNYSQGDIVYYDKE